MTESNSDAASAIGDQGPQRSRDTKCGMTPSLISALCVSKMLFTVLISLCTSTSSKTSSNLQMEDSVRRRSRPRCAQRIVGDLVVAFIPPPEVGMFTSDTPSILSIRDRTAVRQG